MNKKYNYTLFALCFLGGILCGTTSTLVSSYLPNISKDFSIENNENISAIINASFIYGTLFGGLALGFLSDKFGRKMGLNLSLLVLGIFTYATVFVPNWSWLVAFRFMTGVGVGGVLLTTAVLISEVWNEEKKGIALGILSISFPVGIFSAGLIIYNSANWRMAFYIGILAILAAIIGFFFVKESSQWCDNQRFENKNPFFIKDATTLKNVVFGSVIYGTMLIGLWAVFAWLPTWVQSIVQNSDGQQERGISMMLFAVGGLLGGFWSGWLTRKFGMRDVMLACFGGAFALCVVLFKISTTLSIFTYLYMAFIALFFGMSQGVLNHYIPELFPTESRSTATGICFNISRIFTATIVFFVGSLVTTLGGYGNALFSFSFVFLIGFLVLVLKKEK